jgi:hypothetical protein
MTTFVGEFSLLNKGFLLQTGRHTFHLLEYTRFPYICSQILCRYVDSWVVTLVFCFVQKHKVDGEPSTKRGRRKAAEESDNGESAKSEDDDALEEEEEEEIEKKHFTFKDEDHEEDSDSDAEEEKKKKSAKKLSKPSSKKDSKVGVSIFCFPQLEQICGCCCKGFRIYVALIAIC